MVKRGALVTVALQGEFGKPRPALVVQSDQFANFPAVSVLPITSTAADAPLVRIPIAPSASNGLKSHSFIQVDKIGTVPESKIGSVIGHADDATMLAVNRAMAVFLGLA